MFKVKLTWEDTEYTLDELLEICDACEVGQQSFDELAGAGDIATSDHVIRQLVARIKELEGN